MEYFLNSPAFGGIFACPCRVVDEYLNEASPDDLKVLLYILRHNLPEITGDMSDFLGLTKDKISKSFEYWVSRGILVRDSTRQAAASAACASSQAPAAKPAAKKVMQPSVTYSAEEITGLARQSPELKFLLEAASEKLQRLLSAADCSALVYLFSYAGLPADVILMLVEYCVSIGKGNINYIQKTGLGWADDGIDTHERAEEKIKRIEDARSYAGTVRTAMGISGRAFTRSELEHIERWQSEFNTPIELVTQAYEICIERIGRLSFAYINSILKAWHDGGLTTIAQVEAFKKSRKSSKATSYDIDEFVRLSMQRLHGDAPPAEKRRGND
ncbi:MAG: DnaD domain protein [Clostridia bacterium]|nr:DnaD domain protein [Clostridia bacterium]MDR3645280.1 DnaD domain protein [Clostridia bacterium]